MTTPFLPARRLRRLALLPLLFAAVTLTGCGGGDDTTTSTSSAPPPKLSLNVALQDIKTLRLSWNGTEQATGYRLFVETDASAARVAVATLPAGTTQHDMQVFLPDQVNARYTLQACIAAGCADAASANVETALLNSAVGYFKASLPSGRVGQSVALSNDGSTLAVGAPDDNNQVAKGGAVYVFKRSPTGWVQQALVQAATPAQDDLFGTSVAMSSDGHRLVVGASGHASRRGAVFVFSFSNGLWVQEWFQVDPLPWTAQSGWREFGWAVAMSGDGTTLVAGRNDDDYTALVFTRTSGQWESQAAIPAANAYDGTAFALSVDGNTLVMGRRNAATTVGSAGVVDVYARANNAWQFSARLTASNMGDGDGFGGSVAVAGDGKTIAVGAIFEDGQTTGINGPDGSESLNSGAAYVFARSGDVWSQQAYVKASNTGEFDWFGYAVSLSADGNTLAVSAVDEDSSATGLNGTQDNNAVNASGAVYVFKRRGGAWHQSSYVKATGTDPLDRFGNSIALAGDGQTLAVGAAAEDSASTGIGGDQNNNLGGSSGAVYLY